MHANVRDVFFAPPGIFRLDPNGGAISSPPDPTAGT